jgi:hypothetical protein
MAENPAAGMIQKSSGFTDSERMLAEFCDRTFLRLWSYPNPFKSDGHELCDLLAVFGNHIFIFFDRHKVLPHDTDKDLDVIWNRWKSRSIDAQISTAHGAERYIRGGGLIYLDGKRTMPFPLALDLKTATIHKIIVAHGAQEACKQASEQNVYGSLAITYAERENVASRPFLVLIDKRHPVHIFDSHNLPIVLGELDTVTDFANYLDEKERAIARYEAVVYCGEEDLLGHYLANYDQAKRRHIIGTNDPDINSIMVGEGEWSDFIQTDLYKNTKQEDEVSYFWDELIQRTCQNALDGTLGGNSDLLRGESAIFEMVKEPRFFRRALSERIRKAVIGFPDRPGQTMRQVTFLPSFFDNVGYVFFQLRMADSLRDDAEYLDFRRKMLEIACGAAKNKFPNLIKVIGIGMDAPKFAGDTNSEDFIFMPCEVWSKETQQHYESLNAHAGFFQSPQLKKFEEHITQFVPPKKNAEPLSGGATKFGRNEQCPCGSGRKFKKCHGG